MGELYLIHHGIEGQKWGVQNGPPYPLDKTHYTRAEKKALKRANKEEIKRRKQIKKYSRLIPDDQLKDYNKRLEDEKRLKKNINFDVTPESVNKTNEVLESAGKTALISIAGTTAAYLGYQIVGTALETKFPGAKDAMNKGFKKYVTPKK